MKKKLLSTYCYEKTPGVCYIVNRQNIVLIQVGKDNTLILNYPEAIIWDLFIKGYAPDKIIRMCTTILQTEQAACQSLFKEVISLLRNKDFIRSKTNG